MASTYVNDLRLNEMATGDGSGTWGTTTNTNLELIAEAFSYGTEVITTNADTHTTTIADGATDPGRALYLKYTGTLDSACTITIGPNTVSKVWIIENGTSGSQDIILSQGSGANITIPAGDTKVVYSDGAGAGAAFFDAFASLSVVDLKVQDDLTVTDDASVGGDLTITGASTAATYNGIASKTFGTDSIMIGDTTTGTISAANNNVGLGVGAFNTLTTGDSNIAIGHQALYLNATGSLNIAIGHGTLYNNTASNNTAVGYFALISNTTASDNTAVGHQAATSTTTGDGITAVGSYALGGNTTGVSNVAVGGQRTGAVPSALSSNTEGNSNTAVGTGSLSNNTTASNNTAVGYLSLYANTTGIDNVAVGDIALQGNTTGSDNVAVGRYAGYSGATASRSTFVGSQSGFNVTGNDNVGVGYQALNNGVVTGASNTAIGTQALLNNTSASHNTAVGRSALAANTEASDNTAVGYSAGSAITTGTQNICIGASAGDALTTGDENIIIGYTAEASAVGATNQIVMGRGVVGNANTSFCFGEDTNDSAIAFGATSITAPSDQRYKEEITDSTAGLSFINDLRPVTYKWKKEKDIPTTQRAYVEGSEKRVMNDYINHGFIAQEVKTVIDAHSEIKNGFDMWKEDDLDGRQRLAPSALIPMLVKAIQELSAEVETLKSQIGE
jgi:trimeric autotransporter adhesin